MKITVKLPWDLLGEDPGDSSFDFEYAIEQALSGLFFQFNLEDVDIEVVWE